MMRRPISSETAKQPLLCGRHPLRSNGRSASTAGTRQVRATQAFSPKTFVSQSGQAIPAQDFRVIKGLIIHPAPASSWPQYVAPPLGRARLSVDPARDLGVIKRLIIQSPRALARTMRNQPGLGCCPALGACVIKPLIIHRQPTAGGPLASQPALVRLPAPAWQTKNFSVIKRLIPPLVLVARKAPSTVNFHPTEPCSAGFSRFWGAILQGRHL